MAHMRMHVKKRATIVSTRPSTECAIIARTLGQVVNTAWGVDVGDDTSLRHLIATIGDLKLNLSCPSTVGGVS